MLHRREFLKWSAVAGVGAVSGAYSPPLVESDRPEDAGIPGQATKGEPFELEEWSVAELQEAMESGRVTASRLAELYMGRIGAVDTAGPQVNAVLWTNPDALAIAAELDEERAQAGPRGPLHGVPVLLKDNIDTGDRMPTTAGSKALEGAVAGSDAFLVQRLREAGAVILGKANLSEWANFRSERSSSGWSGLGGQTRNPYVLDRNPCGSSSGSAVGVAANLCALAVGTETDGSVVCPSSANGIVGIKPTLGVVSRSGIIPIAHSQDTAGPMARTVRDAASLLGAMAGVDVADSATTSAVGKIFADYTQFLDAGGLEGARVGISRGHFGFHEKVDQIMEEAILAMREQGAEIIDEVALDLGDVGDPEYEVLLYEFKHDLNRYLGRRGGALKVTSLKELIEFNELHREVEMPYFEQEIFLKAQEKGGLDDAAYREALAKSKRLTQTEGIDAAMEKHRLDAIIAPTGGPAWKTDLVNGDHFGGGSSSAAAVAGYPNVTVPAGFVFGLPVGLSFFGSAFSEPALLKLAYAFEQATKIRRPPEFRAVAIG